MNCKECREQISSFIDDQTDTDVSRKVTKHIEECPRCTVYYQDLLKNRALSAMLEEMELPDGFHKRLMTKIRQEAKTGSKPLWKPQRILAPLVAALLLFMVGRGLVMSELWPGSSNFQGLTTKSESLDGEFGTMDIAMEQPESFDKPIEPAPEAAPDDGIRSEDTLITPDVEKMDSSLARTAKDTENAQMSTNQYAEAQSGSGGWTQRVFHPVTLLALGFSGMILWMSFRLKKRF